MRTQIHVGSQPASEYSVYIYHPHRAGNQSARNNWERTHVTHDENDALEQAKALFESNQYHRVEIKKRTFDPKTDQSHDEVYKILDENSAGFTSLMILLPAGFFILAALISIFVIL